MKVRSGRRSGTHLAVPSPVRILCKGSTPIIGAREKLPYEDERCPQGQEPEVPGELVGPGSHVMDLQDVVIHDPLDQIE